MPRASGDLKPVGLTIAWFRGALGPTWPLPPSEYRGSHEDGSCVQEERARHGRGHTGIASCSQGQQVHYITKPTVGSVRLQKLNMTSFASAASWETCPTGLALFVVGDAMTTSIMFPNPRHRARHRDNYSHSCDAEMTYSTDFRASYVYLS